MKQYLSAVLINALLIQLVGCYSQKAITYQEFYDMQNTAGATILTNKNKLIKLTTDSLKYNYVKWIASEDSITIWSTHYVREHRAEKVVSDTVKLASSEIDKVFIDEFNGTKTFFAIAIPVAIVIAVGVIVASNFSFSGPLFSGHGL
ncbi:MAG: hypothetical protein IH620_07355 [Ignavibacterium sp.]|nr:hypothetical protein [Ignavibacterium sp.]